jgi:hypothetical protein
LPTGLALAQRTLGEDDPELGVTDKKVTIGVNVVCADTKQKLRPEEKNRYGFEWKGDGSEEESFRVDSYESKISRSFTFFDEPGVMTVRVMRKLPNGKQISAQKVLTVPTGPFIGQVDLEVDDCIQGSHTLGD